MTEAQGQPTPDAAPSQEGQQERAFTQADIKKIAANEKREGKQSAISELLEKTGAESIDDVLTAYTEHQSRREADESAAEKAEKAKTKAEERASAAEERYTTTLREFALRDSLRDAGINPERLKGAMRLADTSSLEVDAEGNVTGLDEVVEAVREEAPEFFGATERPRVNAPQTNGTGVQTPASNTDPQQSYADWLLGVLQQQT
jgi:hypothetical protein